MKSTIYYLLIMLFCLTGLSNTQAQVGAEGRMGAEDGGYWLVGLNLGFAWQDSDIKSNVGGGWGFYVGRSIFHKPQSPFSLDLRFRYMGTWTYGQNHSDSLAGNSLITNLGYRPDSLNFAHNHETVFHDLSLELRLNFEQLRRKHRVLLAIYGGVGLGIYNTGFDQRDLLGSTYNYEGIDFSQDKDLLCEEIDLLRDHEYETRQATRLTFTPSVGIELGYWFSPHFALSIGHRSTFTLSDRFDGVQIDNGGAVRGAIHHYTALNFHWRITPRAKKTIDCPEIDFNSPIGNSQTHTTNQPSIFVKATVKNLTRKQVVFVVNGQESSNFTHSEYSGEFKSAVSLQEGSNTITIRGRNKCGSDGQQIIIIYKPDNVAPQPQPPVVTITRPATTPTTINTASTMINATILHVNNSNDVTFTVNGQPNRDFRFSGTSFSATGVQLLEGRNTIMVAGNNQDGTDSKTVIINYIKNTTEPELPPVVNILSPQPSPYTTSESRVTVKASVRNVDGRSGVRLTVNGQPSNNFSFSGSNFLINSIALQPGNNTFTITGTNNVGQDSKTLIVIYNKVLPNPPVVTITNPNQNPATTQVGSVNIGANILYVPTKSGVRFSVNGQNYTSFSFSGTRFQANGITLREGNNTFTITGTNEAGQDTKSTVVIYQKPRVVSPPIVTITNPNQTPSTTTIARATIQATILNVTGKNNVSFVVNGQPTSNFSFSGTAFSSSTISLNQGSNTFTITGTNEAGQDTKTTVIIYGQPVVTPKPIVTITNPRQNPYSTQNSSIGITADIKNVSSRNDVTFQVNGMNVGNFTFSGTSFAANGINLRQGNNIMTITGRNSAGQDTKSTVVVYNKVVVAKPVVTITTPNQNPYTTATNSTNIRATILNVATKNNVTFQVNGQTLTNFSFSGTSFIANGIGLKNGSNTFTITGTNEAGQDTKTTIVIYNMPVATPRPVVTITIPNQNPFTTQTAAANIKATILNVATRNDVTFQVNGMNVGNFTFSGTSFTANGINLREGNNTFTVTGRNTAGQDSKSTVIIYRKPVTPKPVVNITSPSNGQQFTVNTTNVTATILNVESKADVTFTVNGQPNTNFIFTGQSFTASNIILNPGNNTIVITGRNTSGQDTKSTIVNYTQPVVVPKPVVVILSPNQNPFTTQTATANIIANIKNVDSKNNVTFTINGQPNTNFTFSGQSFSATNVTLAQGNNTFVITGQNTAGQDSKATVIIYRKPVVVPKPIVTITSPSNGQQFTVNQTNVTANIKNVTNKNDVTFTVNGQVSTNFTFSGQSFAASNVVLNPGNNTIIITGRNTAGQDTKSTTVTYTKPVVVPKPIVTITSPSNGQQFTVNQTNVTANIKNVTSKNDVTFTVNGQVSTNFTFSGQSFAASNVVLNPGNNTIVITGRNTAGQDTKSTIVNYTKPVEVPKPVVVILNPNQNPFTTQGATANIIANIKNVKSKNNVTFTINGQPNTNFTFSGQSFSATNVTLAQGNNTFVITGQNTAGQDTKSTMIIRTAPAGPKPIVTIQSPDRNPEYVNTPAAIIRADIRNVTDKSGVRFTVNGQVITNFIFVNGAFKATGVALSVGSNTIAITGTNANGSDSKSTVLIYTAPVVLPNPVVTITNPAQNPYNVQINKTNVNATIKNVPNKNEVTFKLNGQAVPNSSFTYVNGAFSIKGITLVQGNNTISITGKNTTGQDTKSTVIVYTVPQAKPVVTILVPNQNPFNIQTNTVNLIASIRNVASKNDITFTINGQSKTNFTFSGTNFSANGINLSPGKNTLTVTGRNSSGQDTKSTVVVYTPPTVVLKARPEVIITAPAPNSSTNMIHNRVTATLKNVVKKGEITFKVNGVVNTNFSYSKGKLVFESASFKLGANTISITATNAGGTDSKSITVMYAIPRLIPNVALTAPATGSTVTANKVNISANIMYVTNKADLTVKVNGVATPFTFASNKVTASVPLTVGANTIEVFAKNTWGQDKKTVTVTSQQASSNKPAGTGGKMGTGTNTNKGGKMGTGK